MLVSYICWVIALTLLSSKVNGAHFLSNLCTENKIGTYPYPGVNDVYFECEYGNATIYACPLGTNFNPIFMICSKGDVPYERKDCFKNDLHLPHPFDCTKFIICLNSKIKVIDCKFPTVYSIDTSQCEYRNRVSACRGTLANVSLRTDLNTYIHYNPNEILDKKRDLLHELTDLDEDVKEELDELNVDSSQLNSKLNAPIQNEIHDDDILYSSKKNSPNKISINFSNTIPRKSQKNYSKDKLSMQDMSLLLRGLGAPFNIALINNNNKNITNSEKAFIKSFENLLEMYLLSSFIDEHDETSTENFNLSLQTNTSSPNVNVSNDSMTSTNEARQFPDDITIVPQPIETTSPIFPSSQQPEEKKTDNVTISEEIQSASDFSQKRNTSELASNETSTVLIQMEDVDSNITSTTEITNNTIDLEQHSDTSTPLMSTSEIAETTLQYSNNDVAVTVDSVVSQRISTSFLSTTSTSVSDITNTDIGITVNENLESSTSTLITFNTESSKLKEVDGISEDIESTPVSTQLVEIKSSTIAANRVPENAKTTTDRSTLEENISEMETSTSLHSTSSRPSSDTEDIVAQSVTPFSEQSMNIPVVQNLNANITATSELENTTRLDSLQIVSSATENHESTKTFMISQNFAVTTESLKIDSTSIEPEYISERNNQKNDETLEIIKNINTTSVSQSVGLSTTPEYISTTANQNNDKFPTTLEHVSSFVENQRHEETSTLLTDNILINESNITNQEIPDAPKIQNERFPRNVDSEIVQVGESNDDKIRPSTFIEPANLTEKKKYPSFVYAWHDAKNMRAISISTQRLRLNGTAQANYGYVEVKGVDDIWRGVCQPTYWTIAEADIICRELGYQNGAEKAWKGHSDQIDIPAWTSTSSIQCDGDEEWVDKCRFQDETECDLQHNAVGVECLLHDANTY